MKPYKKEALSTMEGSGIFWTTCKSAAEANGIQTGAVSARLRSGKMVRLPAGVYDTVGLIKFLSEVIY